MVISLSLNPLSFLVASYGGRLSSPWDCTDTTTAGKSGCNTCFYYIDSGILASHLVPLKQWGQEEVG